MLTLGIDTSCDETSVAVVNGQKIISNSLFSQISLHQPYGGVMPAVAKRAHVEKLPLVLKKALLRANLLKKSEDESIGMKKIDQIAITVGPGLAIALEVGLNTAISLSEKYDIPLVPINHLWGHLYSCFAQNRFGNPSKAIEFPYLALLVSGGHTQLIKWIDHGKYELLGETLDDAAGEALDKIAKYMGLGYPGGPILERLAEKGDASFHSFPLPMSGDNLSFSFSGLKTSFVYFYANLSDEEKLTHLNDIAASFQYAVFRHLLYKLEKACLQTNIKNWLLVGGVSANSTLRKMLKVLQKKYDSKILFPSFKYLCGDNAAMVGIAGHFHSQLKDGVIHTNKSKIHRLPNWDISIPFSQNQ